jgi:hypothetical protein
MFEVDILYRRGLQRAPTRAEFVALISKVYALVTASQAGGETDYTGIVRGTEEVKP